MQSAPPPQFVLVVDDEFLVRMVAVDLPEERGFQTLEAASGPEALAILERHPEIDILLTDINMPGHPDGLVLAHVAREQRPDISIVVTSGRLSPGPTELPRRCRFIGKPYTGEQLMFAVQMALDIRG